MFVLAVALWLSMLVIDDRQPTAVSVFPSGSAVPASLLRILIRFEQPQEEEIAEHLTLRGAQGVGITTPFINVPLWSADHRELTLLLDPSRQKPGLRNHNQYGYVLKAGSEVALYEDARRLKTWRVSGTGCPNLLPENWKLSSVQVGSRTPLVVHFTGPIDEQSQDLLAVVRQQHRIAGISTLQAHETQWTFTPARPWTRGAALALHPRLEDPCGNEIGEAFDHQRSDSLAGDRMTLLLPLSYSHERTTHK